MSLFATSPDDWLDEKRKLDGAEGLWRIHDKLYDLTVWARSHPGGKFWINATRGTDITEAFESNHFSGEAESLLQKFYRREASSPRNSDTTFRENGFFKRFKRKLVRKYPETDIRPPLTFLLGNDCLVAAVFLTGLLGLRHGFLWTIASGVLSGVLAISSHAFLHSKDNWRVYYFDISLMSSREWRIIHVLSHHQYRGTVRDLEIPVWRPFSKSREGLTRYLLNFPGFAMAAHIQFMRRCLDVLSSKKLSFHPEELIAFSFPLFLFLFGGARPWETFVTWNHVILIGSFIHCLFGSISDKSHEQNPRRGNKDFGIAQLSLVGSHPKKNESALSFLNSFRGNALHYLCPAVKWGSLNKLIPAFDEASDECSISFSEESNGFLEGIQEAEPEGHLFFS